MKFTFAVISCAILFSLFVYGVFQFNKWLNWKLSYESMVEKKIEQMVKPDSLVPKKQ